MFAGKPRDVTEGTRRARAGTILTAISKFGLMVVTTGNKSKCHGATLYGDMNGGFNPVKDL